MEKRISLLFGIIFFCIIFLVVFVLIFVFKTDIFGGVTGGAVINEDKTGEYSFTKAICEGKTCVDYEITCKGAEAVNSQPITGAVTFSEDWEDLRTSDLINKSCS